MVDLTSKDDVQVFRSGEQSKGNVCLGINSSHHRCLHIQRNFAVAMQLLSSPATGLIRRQRENS